MEFKKFTKAQFFIQFWHIFGFKRLQSPEKMKTLWIMIVIALFAGLENTNCSKFQDVDANLTTVYTDDFEVWKRRSNSTGETYLLGRSNSKGSFISDLSYNQGYLWISKSGNQNSVIYRAKVGKNNSPQNNVNLAYWTEHTFGELMEYANFSEGALVRVVPFKDGNTLLGFKNKVIKLCGKSSSASNVGEENHCRTVFSTRIGQGINGFDYSHCNSHFYLLLTTGSVLRCGLSSTTDSCQTVHRFNKRTWIKPVKAAFGAIWIGVNATQLWKCPLNRGIMLSCRLFHHYEGANKAKIRSIAATKDHLYVNVWGYDKISRCDSLVPKSCEPGFSKKIWITTLDFIQDFRELC